MTKKTITITALTEKGKKALETKNKARAVEKAVIKLFGIKEKIISVDPLKVETTFKRVPDLVLDQIILGLHTKLEELGAEANKDYKLECI